MKISKIMKRNYILYFFVTVILILVSALIHVEVYALLVIVSVATLKLLKTLFVLEIRKLNAVFLVVSSYICVTIIFGNIYFLMPLKVIEPPFSNNLSGLLDAMYFSFV
ncbi:hypothetical protein ACFL5B_03500, partial [Candidatus Latescibacterota bacterium]